MICDNGDCCPLREVCRRSGISKQTVNSAVRKLEAEGVVYLRPDGARNKSVCLTEEGKRLAKRTAVRMIEAENEIFASWTKEEVSQYLALTEKFLQAVREKAEKITGGDNEDSII